MADYLSPELAEIVERGYRDGALAAPASLGVCTACCMDPDLARRMRRTPVGDVTPEMIDEWYSAAFDGDIGGNVLLWLLPRVLDLLAQGQELCISGNEVAFKRCAQTAFVPDWPAPQRQLIEDFAPAYVDARLDQPDPKLDATLCMFALSGMDLSGILDRLDRADPPRLARAIVAEWKYGPPRIGQSAFWDWGEGRRQVADWFARPALAERLWAWALAHDGDAAELALEAGDMIWSGRPPNA